MAHFALQSGLVAGLVPWWLTGWHMRHPLPSWTWALRTAGAALLAAGAVVLVQAFVRFVTDGMGTPAPVAPAEQLVVSGPYRYVRNPMYLAVIAGTRAVSPPSCSDSQTDSHSVIPGGLVRVVAIPSAQRCPLLSVNLKDLQSRQM
jgi:protein-S-isoprenylcysteine O-methyltransferase Ste14